MWRYLIIYECKRFPDQLLVAVIKSAENATAAIGLFVDGAPDCDHSSVIMVLRQQKVN